MKYPAHIYAKVLTEVAGGPAPKDDAIVMRNFLALVRKYGDEVHLQKIIEEAERFLAERAGVRKVRIESARALTGKEEKMVKEFLKPGDVVEKKITPELVAGIKILLNEAWEFDGSLKGKLDAMFSTIQP